MSPSRVQNDYMVAQQIEDKDRAVYLDEKSQAEAQNDKAVQYQMARQEATQSRTLYENLVAPYEGSRRGRRDAFQQHHPGGPGPRAARPAKPNVLIYAAGSIAGGLLFGICGALFREATDNRIQELGEMEMLLPKHPSACSPTTMRRSERKRMPSARTPLLGTLCSPFTLLHPR